MDFTIIIAILFLVFLEGILSFDNALALAGMVKHLPDEQRKKALTYGMAGAFVFRIAAIFLVTYLMENPWIKLVGGGYLVWLGVSHFVKSKQEEAEVAQTVMKGFWMTVLSVELMDIVFSVDSILAAIAISNVKWVIILGGIIGIVMMRFASFWFSKLMTTFPRLEDTAFLLVLGIGTKLTVEYFVPHDWHTALLWTMKSWSAICLIYGFSLKLKPVEIKLDN